MIRGGRVKTCPACAITSCSRARHAGSQESQSSAVEIRRPSVRMSGALKPCPAVTVQRRREIQPDPNSGTLSSPNS